MRSFLGVPILLRGVAYGNLYLTEKEGGGGFTDEDEDLTQLLAAQAAVAIENTRLYDTSTRWLRHLESLSEIGDALAGELELEPLLGLVARRLRDLINARLVLIALPEPGRERLRIAAVDGEGSDAYGLVGIELELGGSKTGRVLQRGRSERVDSVLDDPEMDQQVARRMGVRSALYVPLLADGTTDRRRGHSRQARRSDVELHRRGRPAHRVARGTGRDGGRRSRNASAVTQYAASSRRRSSSVRDSRGSCTTRPARP